jgi:serine-type D-Ala-D-Ala carboxypeptidase/endopeptidase
MTSDGSADLGNILSHRFSRLSPGLWGLASVAVRNDDTSYWCSDAVPTSAFHIGSVTKTMTALALASLTVQGRVELADRLGTYLEPASDTEVRLVDLATHRAGYPRLPARLAMKSLRTPTDPYSRLSDRDIDRAVARETRQRRKAPHEFLYSNFGFGVLSRALAAAGEDSFINVVRSEVLVPLGLGSTTLDLAEDEGRLVGHDAAGRAVPNWHNPALPGCGCLWSTIEDVHSYLRANLHPQTTPLADALRLAHTPREAAGPDNRIGLAWMIGKTDHGTVYWHNGGTSGFGAFVGFNPERNVGVGVLQSRAHSNLLDAEAMTVLAELGCL